MEPNRSEQSITVVVQGGTEFQCSVEWVDQPLRSGAEQCVAEHWVFRAGDLVCVGPPVSEITSPDDLQRTLNVWWQRRK
jgi:hypothetical protein